MGNAVLTLQPVVLSGGSGTRLWPLSRDAYPKQFHVLSGDHTMLQQTVERVLPLAGNNLTLLDPLVVCNEAHRFLAAEQLRQIEISPAGILLEPVGRNTAPALTLAALQAVAGGNDPVLLVMPADHLVANQEQFRRIVAEGLEYAGRGHVVTFGIVPVRPETGFGYIQCGEKLDDASGYKLARFVEKPDEQTAQRYLAEGSYLWNSGLFMMKASIWLALVEQFRPDISNAVRGAFSEESFDGDFCRIDRQAFEACPSESIDYAVMEPLANTENDAAPVVIPLDAGWSDVGAWTSLWEVRDQDDAGNVIDGDVVTVDTENCLLMAHQRMVATVGVSELVVVETADAILVGSMQRSQDVKRIADELRSVERREIECHQRVYRPWGDFEPIDCGTHYQVKRLTVKPGASLSLQMHHHRAEHWVVVHGTARVTKGDEVFLLSENQSTYIPIGCLHRLENPGTIPLEIIEVQSGRYLGEDDIVRYDDAYNRTSDE